MARNFSGNFDIDPEAFARECAAWIERRWPTAAETPFLQPAPTAAADKSGWMTAMRRLIAPQSKART